MEMTADAGVDKLLAAIDRAAVEGHDPAASATLGLSGFMPLEFQYLNPSQLPRLPRDDTVHFSLRRSGVSP